MSKGSALGRAADHFKSILRGVREDLLREKAVAEDAFVSSLEGEKHGGISHIAEADPPDRAAQRRSIDLGQRIQQIDAAFGRIDRGTFGNCLKNDECEGDGKIEHELLVKDPTRIYCRACQETENDDATRKRKLDGCRGTISGRRGR